ncbi:hypothetical protein BDP81DRAFT_476657 [Colletotrichum phormii]|uniref:Clr5 domain-containing protein n=1 Tax=Colletotrichum phormii TaxID=359342 RepID=A0AAI9ZCJ9_9PEZI|nr:uncharacterized protein BDP81DRAFT_476657 [Colletotrichum phormii]KAK1621998.1 hypothetical protein BDP81DRAFT_476657 [Colletotrichum phormii]
MDLDQGFTYMRPSNTMLTSVLRPASRSENNNNISPSAIWLMDQQPPIQPSLVQPQVASLSAPFPTFVERPYRLRPESASDWETQRATLHKLYMEYNWRKYKTKGVQQRSLDGKPVETLNHSRTMVTQGASATLMLYGSESERWIEELYASLRDLMCGRQRRNIHHAGAVLRQAFRDLDSVIEEEPCTSFQDLMLHIPNHLCLRGRYKETDACLYYISKLLNIKKQGQPIARIANMMRKIGARYRDKLRNCVVQMFDIAAHLFRTLRKTVDLTSLMARRWAWFEKEQNDELETAEFFDTHIALLEISRESLGETDMSIIYQEYAHTFELLNRSTSNDQGLLQRNERLLAKLRVPHPSSDELYDIWTKAARIAILQHLANGHLVQSTESRINHLEEVIRLKEYLAYERAELDTNFAVEAIILRRRLAGILAHQGQTERAAEILSVGETSNYLVTTLRSDLECNAETIESWNSLSKLKEESFKGLE